MSNYHTLDFNQTQKNKHISTLYMYIFNKIRYIFQKQIGHMSCLKEEFHKNIYLFKNGNTCVTVPQHNIWTKQGQNTNQTPVKDYWSCKRSLLRREVSSCGQTMLSFNKTPFGKVILWFWNISVDFFSLSVLTTTSGTDWNRKILYTNNFI